MPQTKQFPKVGLLATGNELILGDTANSNSQYMAKKLTENNIQAGMQLVVSDEEPEIMAAMQFLLAHHKALIIIGGLGPTSDDRTRFALSKALDLPLVFNEVAWENVTRHFTKRQRPPEACTKQQALFPEDATIFPNMHGTAAGCEFQQQAHTIYMLPGPPKECLPIFDERVLPSLLKQGFQQNLFRRSWMLYNVFEAHIAAQLDPIANDFDCELGYRLCYPNLEIRLIAREPEELERLTQRILPIIQPYLT